MLRKLSVVLGLLMVCTKLWTCFVPDYDVYVYVVAKAGIILLVLLLVVVCVG